jgi:serine kinase of HPr protein (carbohydrate metabolism regulator)
MLKNCFGASAVRSLAKIDLVIRLEEWDRTNEYELLGFEQKYTTIPDVKVFGIGNPHSSWKKHRHYYRGSSYE